MTNAPNEHAPDDFGRESPPAPSRSSDLRLERLPASIKLRFGGWVLGATAAIYVGSAVCYIFAGEVGKEIFDTGTKILPPIATLILGHYFAKAGV